MTEEMKALVVRRIVQHTLALLGIERSTMPIQPTALLTQKQASKQAMSPTVVLLGLQDIPRGSDRSRRLRHPFLRHREVVVDVDGLGDAGERRRRIPGIQACMESNVSADLSEICPVWTHPVRKQRDGRIDGWAGHPGS